MQRIAAVLFLLAVPAHAGKFALQNGRWLKDGAPTHQGTPAAGRLLNVRMVNGTFDDQNPDSRPHGFHADYHTEDQQNKPTLTDPPGPAREQARPAPQASPRPEPIPWS